MDDELVALLRNLLGQDPLPKPFDLLEIARGRAREPGGPKLSPAAKRLLAEIVGSRRPLETALGLPEGFRADTKLRQRVQTMLGRLLLGVLAERAFESIYKSTLGTTELALEDARGARDDTDYRVLNGKGRPVFRINIKFHGTLFQKAEELVGLDPEDCFALATYKIKQGLDKQDKEFLPYVFIVVSCPVSALDVGAAIPTEFVDLACAVSASRRVSGKRRLEEKIVDHLAAGRARTFMRMLNELTAKLSVAPWRIISARRADNLLRQLLFERVYAVRVRAFNRNYRNAEVDMHLSLAKDMTPLAGLLQEIGAIGLHGVASKLERGAF